MHDMQVKTDSHIINVNITSNCNSFNCERRFDKGITVQTLKDKLELITGARSQLMTIEIFDSNDAKICELKVNIVKITLNLIPIRIIKILKRPLCVTR